MRPLLARWKLWCVLAGLLAVAALSSRFLRNTDSEPEQPGYPIQFREVTDESGVGFVHWDGSSGRRYILESMSAGIATFDYNGDGLIDIYFPNGAALPGADPARQTRHTLYKNLGNWKFDDVTEKAGVASTEFGLGVTVGDYDNDGWPDLFLNNFGANVLYRNNGDGSFTDVTDGAGIARGESVAAGACFLDADADGWLDLYVGNYIDLDLASHVPRVMNGFDSYPSPKAYTPVPDSLYHNNGDGTFTDVSEESGIADRAGRSMGMVCADVDGDGATDVFVLNDVQDNFLFRNLGGGKFEESGLMAGVAVNAQGEPLANMGVDCADYDNDGHLDFFTTNYQTQWPMLLRNFGNGTFEDVTAMTGAGEGCLPYVNWGCGLVDFDNDGHRDIFVGNGHTEDNVEERDGTTKYRCTNVVLHNTGTGQFVDVSELGGLASLPPHAARGIGFDDLDNDGDVDVVILNSREPASLLRNMYYEQGGKNQWLQLRLQGVAANRDGVGARVRVTTGDVIQTDEVHSGRGYQSHWGTRLQCGLGRYDRADRIEVRWMGGGVDVLTDIPAGRMITIVQGSSPESGAGRERE